MTGRRLRVVVCDDEQLVRTGFKVILDAEPDLEVVGEAADGREAIDVVLRTLPDVVLMDVRMPTIDGIEATRRLLALPGVEARVLMLTTFDLDEYVVDAIRAGASGFLLKDTHADELIRGVRAIAAGDALLAPRITRRLLERAVDRLAPGSLPPELAQLTERERDVLVLLARGLANAEIAGELVVAETTVKTHVSNVLGKLGLRDRVQAVVFAYESGLVVPGDGRD